MLKNTNLFKFSLSTPEPLIDDAYVKSDELIVSSDYTKVNKLMAANTELLENISAYKIALKSRHKKLQKEIIHNVKNCLEVKNINYSEFPSFWAVTDVSYSTYKKLTSDQKIKFLNNILVKYLEYRHGMYLRYGYSYSTLQVSKDAKAHKQSGPLGVKKVNMILDKHGFKFLKKLNLDSIDTGDYVYINTDKTGKKLFKEIITKYGLNFFWGKKADDKFPDVLFKIKNDLFIIEHKHMKEGGGGQNKQVNEVIQFINYSESKTKIKVHYVTFMDGLYFNLFGKNSSKSKNKISTQISNILDALKNNPNNYFVNTAGFIKLLECVSHN